MVKGLSLWHAQTSATCAYRRNTAHGLHKPHSCKCWVTRDRTPRRRLRMINRHPASAGRHEQMCRQSSSCRRFACLTSIWRTLVLHFCGVSIPLYCTTLGDCCSSRNTIRSWRVSWRASPTPSHLYDKIASQKLRIFATASACLVRHPIQLPKFLGDLHRARRLKYEPAGCSETACELVTIAVQPRLRRQGHGKALILALAEAAKCNRMAQLRVHHPCQ